MLAELKRIRRMDAPEIGWRLREKLLAGLERAAVRVGAVEESDTGFVRALGPAARNGTGNDTGDAPVLGFLRRSMAPRFHLPGAAAERAALARAFRRRFAGRLPAIEAEAERLCAHRVELLGLGEVDLGAGIDWHRDPVTGRLWERRFWADYDLVRDGAAGDPKCVLELNRHQHLPRLAKAWFLGGDERFAREAVAQMRGWIDQNPPGVGVNWHSSLDVALRATSWIWTLAFLLGSEALDEPAARAIAKSLFAQLDHVHRYPSLYSSPNTHLLGEATALYVAGSAFAACPRGRAWRERGERLLAAEIERQVGSDGAHRELSPWYHCYALDFALQALAIARLRGRHLPAPAVHRIEGMLDFLLQVIRPDGTLPLLGDDDGGRALALATADYRRPADLLATGAVLFGRGALKAGAGAAGEGRCEETFWLLGEAGLAELEALPLSPPEATPASFPDAGYFVQRSGWNEDDGHLVFDCGGLGGLGGGHGHADALSISLYAGGAELLVDPGTYRYNGAREWRDYFRSTAAHNTVVIDGRDQSVPGDTFRWQRQASTRLLADARFGGVEYLAGEHDGYTGAPDGVIHRRRVLYVRPDYWLVFDDFRPVREDGGEHDGEHPREHDYELLFHLPPGGALSPVEYGGDRREAALRATAGRGGLDLAVHTSAPLEVHAVEGASAGPRGPQGWVSRRYGERRPAPVAIARFRAAAPAAAITVLLPAATGADGHAVIGRGAGGRHIGHGWGERPDGGWSVRPVPVTNGCGAALALALRHPGGEDLAVLAPDGGAFEAGPLSGRGELFWARREGATGRLLAVRADACELDGVPVLEAAAADPFTFHRQEPTDVRDRRFH